MRRFLSYELDRYLLSRGMERKREVPLVKVENQPYIHYQKGSLVMYALLWSGGPWSGGLPAGLRAPVAAYVLAIALMVSQALGRARVHTDPAAWRVAAGALCFMLSDTLLATDRFLVPLPARDLLVLSTYYAAQGLMVAGLLRAAPRQGA